MLRVAPLDGRVLQVRGLKVALPGRADEPLLSVGEVAGAWNPFALLGGELCVTRLELRGVSARLSERDGQWNFAALFPPKPSRLRRPDLRSLRLPLAVNICDVSVRDLVLTVERESGERIEIGPLSLSFSARFDDALRGRAGLWWDVEALRAQAARPLEAGFEGALRGRASLVREDTDQAKLQADLSVRDGRGILRGRSLRAPIAADGHLAATLDLAHLSLSEAEASFRLSGILEDRLDLRLARAAGWRFEADNVLSVDLAALGDCLVEAFDALGEPPQFARGWDVESFRLEGSLQVESRLRGALTSGSRPELRFNVENRTTGTNISAASEVHLRRPQGGTLKVSGDVRDLHLEHDCTLKLALGEGLVARTQEAFDFTVGRAGLVLGDLCSLECRDAAVSGSAAGEFPRPLNAAVLGRASAGNLAVSGPAIGRVALPVELEFALSGRDLTRPAASVVIVERLSGSLGAVVPTFSLEGVIEGYGREELRLSGGGTLDLRQALALMGGVLEAIARERGSVLAAVSDLAAEADIAGVVEGTFEVTGRMSGGERPGGLEVTLGGEADLQRAGFSRKGIEALVKEVGLDFSCGVSLGPDFRPTSAEGRLSADVGPALFSGDAAKAELRSGRLLFSAEVSGEGLQEVACEFSASARSAGGIVARGDAEGGALRVKPVDIEVSGSALAHIGRGDLALDGVNIRVPGVMLVEDARLEVAGYGEERFAVGAEVNLPDLSAFAGVLSEALNLSLPEVHGSVSVQASAQGRIPRAARSLTALPAAEQISGFDILPLAAFYIRNVPVSGSAKVVAQGVSVNHRVGPELAVGLSGVSASGSFSLEKGDLGGEFEVDVPELRLSPLGSPLKGLRFGGEFELDDFDRLSPLRLRFSALEGAFTSSLEGEVRGLSRLRGMPSAGALLEELDASARADCELRPQALESLVGLRGSGNAGAEVSLRLLGGQSLELGAAVRLEELTLAREGLFAVNGLTVRLPFSKRWRILTSRQATREEPALSERVLEGSSWMIREELARSLPAPGARAIQAGFDPALERLVKPGHDLTIRSVSLFGGEVLEDIALDIRLDEQGLVVPRARLNVLGGDVLARLAGRLGNDGFTVSLEGEFGGVDIRRMLPPHLREFPGDALVGGNLRGMVALRGRERAGSAIKDISASLDLAHIGPKALDRALLLLDPEAENPSIVQIRARLALARPRRVVAKLESGFVSVDVELEGLVGRLVSRHSVPRFSISEALRSEALQRHLEGLGKLARARRSLEALRAGRIVLVGEEGRVEFRTP